MEIIYDAAHPDDTLIALLGPQKSNGGRESMEIGTFSSALFEQDLRKKSGILTLTRAVIKAPGKKGVSLMAHLRKLNQELWSLPKVIFDFQITCRTKARELVSEMVLIDCEPQWEKLSVEAGKNWVRDEIVFSVGHFQESV